MEKTGWFIGTVVAISLVYFLAPILTPFLLAAVLAYLGHPLVAALVAVQLPRTLAAIITFCLIIVIVLLLPLLLIPLLQQQVFDLVAKLPDTLAWLQTTGLPWLNQQLGPHAVVGLQGAREAVGQHWQEVSHVAKLIWTAVFQSGFALIGWIAKLLLVSVVTFYLLRDWDGLISGIRRLLPRSIEPFVCQLANECDQVLSAFFRGQLLVMLALAAIYSVGLWLIGLPLALLIGLLAGLVSIIPYLGMIVGVFVAGIIAFMQYHDGLHLLYVLMVFLGGHAIENVVLTPWLLGHRIGLHPVAVIFALLAGGQLFGFFGLLLALPVAAVLMVLLRHIQQFYVNSSLYSQNRPEVR